MSEREVNLHLKDQAIMWFDNRLRKGQEISPYPSTNEGLIDKMQINFYDKLTTFMDIVEDVEGFLKKSSNGSLSEPTLIILIHENVWGKSWDLRYNFWTILRQLKNRNPNPLGLKASEDFYSPDFRFYPNGDPLFVKGFWKNHPNENRRTDSPIEMMITFGLGKDKLDLLNNFEASQIYDMQGMKNEFPLVPFATMQTKQIDFESLDRDSKRLFSTSGLVFNQLVPRLFDEEIEPSSLPQLDMADAAIEEITPNVDFALSLYDQIISEEGSHHHRDIAMAVKRKGLPEPKSIEEYNERIFDSKDRDLLNVPIEGAELEFAPFFIAYWVGHATMNGVTIDRKIVLSQLTNVYTGQAARFHLASERQAGESNEKYLKTIARSYRARARLTKKLSDVLGRIEP